VKQKIEIALLGIIAGLLAAFVILDGGRGQPAAANDSGGKVSAFSRGGQNAGDFFFLVDTDRKWVGMYTLANNKGPRLVSAQSYQLADALANLKPDSENLQVENQAGWSVKESNEQLDIIQKQMSAQK
jgi:hypothetical protein